MFFVLFYWQKKCNCMLKVFQSWYAYAQHMPAPCTRTVSLCMRMVSICVHGALVYSLFPEFAPVFWAGTSVNWAYVCTVHANTEHTLAPCIRMLSCFRNCTNSLGQYAWKPLDFLVFFRRHRSYACTMHPHIKGAQAWDIQALVFFAVICYLVCRFSGQK